MAEHRDRARLVLFLSATMSASVVSVRLRGHGRVSLKRNLPPELLKRKLPPDARSDGLPTDASSASALGCVYERRPDGALAGADVAHAGDRRWRGARGGHREHGAAVGGRGAGVGRERVATVDARGVCGLR